MNVQVLRQLNPDQRDAVDALLARSQAADDHPALSDDVRDEAGRIDLTHDGAHAVLAEADGELVGCATLSPANEGVSSLHVAVDPDHRTGAGEDVREDVRSVLIRTALAEASHPVRLWIMLADEEADRAVAGLGFRPERDLLQMRVPLPLPEDVLAATRAVETRSFVPGQDDELWLSVNNRAFAGHPEQGNWTLETLHRRERSDWFDADGCRMAPDPDRDGLIGSCWTKVHRRPEGSPDLGEIYVISVDPSRHSQGWGRALTVAGLSWLSAQGLTIGMLYTDASNTAAVALYGSLGFTTDHIDRSYLN